ncbi:MAG TPA: NUDIX domain-containing protein [Opitutaceae bacterium]|nr:NUDIX domain-containing protein [Opitutaceae bacterium]
MERRFYQWSPADRQTKDVNEEIFDIVDENDRVIGQAPRSRVHAEGLRHRAVHVLVINPAGRMFLQKRADTKDNHPGVWDSSCSGHLAAGEDYAAAAVRELAEEIGIATDPPPREILAIRASVETGNEFLRVYTCLHAGPVTPDPVEISEGRWFDPDEIDRWVAARPEEFSPGFRIVWGMVPELRLG